MLDIMAIFCLFLLCLGVVLIFCDEVSDENK